MLFAGTAGTLGVGAASGVAGDFRAPVWDRVEVTARGAAIAALVTTAGDADFSTSALMAAPAAISALVLKSASPAVVTNAAIAAPLAVTSTRSQTGARKSPATPLAAPTPSVPAVPANNIRVVTQRNLHKL